jgi:putative flavoprotein involved in K+ transport
MAKPKVLSMGAPLIRQKPKNLLEAGIKRLPRVKGIKNGRPELENGEVIDVKNVIWCTGFHSGFSWIDFPIFKDGEPIHDRGVVPGEPGLYFVGLHFLFAFSSPMIHGVSRDARYVVEVIKKRLKAPAVGISGVKPAFQSI